jgi:hypothetical protein
VNVDMTASELDRLVADFGDVPKTVLPAVAGVVMKGAGNVTRTAKQLASGIAHAPHYPDSIGFDVNYKATSTEAVIGPDKNRRQGALGNLLEYGSANNPPLSHLGPALDSEGPAFEHHLGDVAEQALP